MASTSKFKFEAEGELLGEGDRAFLDMLLATGDHAAYEHFKKGRMGSIMEKQCKKGDLRSVKRLVQNGLDVNYSDAFGQTPLHYAAERGKLHVVKYLVQEAGAEVESRGHTEATPLFVAAKMGKYKVVKYLAEEAGADVQAKNRFFESPLHISAARGKFKVVRYLIEEARVDVESRGSEGSTALHMAMCGQLRIAKYLIDEAGADVGAKCDNGMIHLHVAAARGEMSLVKYLIEEVGADVGAKCHNNLTPLHQAARNGELEVCKYLIEEALADVGAKTNENNTALDLAVASKHTDVINYLLNIGGDIDLLDQHLMNNRGRFGDLFKDNVQDYAGEKIPFHCFKTVIVGEVESGKTSLRRTIKTRTSQLTEKRDRTVGVEQDIINLDDNIQTCFHDFGGHKTYTHLHQMCLTDQTVVCIAVDMLKYENRFFSQMVGKWYQRTVSRVLQPYIVIIGTKAEDHSDDDLKRKCDAIMNELGKLQQKQRLTLEKHINDLEEKVDQVLQLLTDCAVREKKELVENQDKFVDRVNEYTKEHPDASSKIEDIFAKSPGITLLNILTLISCRRQMIMQLPIVHEEVMCVSSKSMRGIDNLRKTICNIVRDNEALFPVFDIPVSWVKVIEQIPRSKPLLSIDEFLNFCRCNGINSEQEISSCLEYLSAAGIVFQYDDSLPCRRLQSVVLLKPNWIFEIIGCIYNDFYLSGERELPAIKDSLDALCLTKIELHKMHSEFKRNGIMAEKVFKYILHKYGVSKDNMQNVIGILVHLDICCKYATEDGTKSPEPMYRFAFLLTDTPPQKSVHEWPTTCPDGMVEYHMHAYINSPIDPPGMFDKWSIRINDLLKKRYDWKNGCIALLKEGSSMIRMLNHGSESDDDVLYSLCLRVKADKAATMRNILTIIFMQLTFLNQQYPYVVMKWWAVCPECEIPGQWPLDKILNVQPDQAATITCDECCSDMRLDRLYPRRTALSAEDLRVDVQLAVIHRLTTFWPALTTELLGNNAEEVIQEVKSIRPPNLQQNCSTSLTRWFQACGKDATFRRLVEALRQIKRNDIADMIDKKFAKEGITLDFTWDSLEL